MEQTLVEKKKDFHIFSDFILKVLAIVFMTIDHVGYAITVYLNPAVNSSLYTTAFVFRILGRIAFPLFAFLLAEGMLHTKSAPKYFMRLGIIGGLIMIAQVILQYGMKSPMDSGNIFIDLILGGLVIYLLNNKKPLYKVLAILPIGYAILCTTINMMEYKSLIDVVYSRGYFPFWLRMQYDIFGMVLIVGFYYVYKLAKEFHKINFIAKLMDYDEFEKTSQYRTLCNILASTLLLFANLLWYILTILYSGFDYLAMGIESYSMLAIVFIFFYNGLRGYNAKWFTYGSYVYYPLHLVVIYGIFQLILMI